MKLLGFERMLCLSPHPDDVEYSMSGTINKFKDTIFDVFCLSCGTSTDDSSTSERIKEVKLFWDAVGPKNVNLIFSDYSSLDGINLAQLITYIENATIKKQEYNGIFMPSYEDSHFEHKLISGAALAIARNKPVSLFEYRCSSSLHDWTPNFFVNIDDYCFEKIKNLQSSFKSQIDSTYFKQENLELFHKDFISNKKSIAFREMFKSKAVYL